jgi:hypothetical protein
MSDSDKDLIKLKIQNNPGSITLDQFNVIQMYIKNNSDSATSDIGSLVGACYRYNNFDKQIIRILQPETAKFIDDFGCITDSERLQLIPISVLQTITVNQFATFSQNQLSRMSPAQIDAIKQNTNLSQQQKDGLPNGTLFITPNIANLNTYTNANANMYQPNNTLFIAPNVANLNTNANTKAKEEINLNIPDTETETQSIIKSNRNNMFAIPTINQMVTNTNIDSVLSPVTATANANSNTQANIQLVNQVRSHLNNMSNPSIETTLPTDPITPETTVTIQNSNVNVYCLAHFIANDIDFLKEYANMCRDFILSITTDGNLNLTTIMPFNGNNFDQDTNTYKQLYILCYRFAQFIYTTQEFKNSPAQTKLNIINSYRELLQGTISYINMYIKTYTVATKSIIKANINLLYVLYSINHLELMAGYDYNELKQYYDQLVAETDRNIAALSTLENEINSNKATPDLSQLNEINELKKSLQEKINAIREQTDIIEKLDTKFLQDVAIIKPQTDPSIVKLIDNK